MLKRIWNIASTVLIVLLALVTVFNLALYIKRSRTGDSCPTVLGFGMAVVITGSMEPKIRVNDLVLIHEQESYALDEVVTYRTNSKPVTHRIVSMRTDTEGQIWVTTRGDVNNKDDEEIPVEQIVGKVVLTIPFVGAVQEYLQSTEGFLVLTLGVAVLIAVGELLRYFRRR